MCSYSVAVRSSLYDRVKVGYVILHHFLQRVVLDPAGYIGPIITGYLDIEQLSKWNYTLTNEVNNSPLLFVCAPSLLLQRPTVCQLLCYLTRREDG